MLNPQRLAVLRELAQRGSFTAAADALSYTQSAVSQQISLWSARRERCWSNAIASGRA
jgi:DNA-binding transcriptional LysR family regulator